MSPPARSSPHRGSPPRGSSIERPERLALGALTLVALGWRLLLIAQRQCIETDGAHYAHLARRALEHGPTELFHPAWPPLYPLATALVARLLPVGNDVAVRVELAGTLVSALAGTALLPLAWLLVRRWAGARVAWGATLLLAFHPQALRYSTAVMSEALFALLFLASFALVDGLVHAARDREATAPRGRALLAGALCGLATWARPEGWALAGGALLVLAFARARRARSARLAFTGGLTLVGVPQLLWLGLALGAPSLGAKGPYNFHLAHAHRYAAAGLTVEEGDVMSLLEPGEAFEPGDYRVGEVLAAQPLGVALDSLWTLGYALVDKLPSLVGWLLVPFWLRGLLRARFALAGPWRRVGIVFALHLVLLAPLFVHARFFLPFLPFLCAATAIGLDGWPRRRLYPVLVALAVVAMAVHTWRRQERNESALHPRMAETLRAAAADGPVRLAGLKPEAAYYAGVSFRRLTPADRADPFARLTELGATHLLLDDHFTAEMLPGLETWLDAPPDWLVDPVPLADEHRRLVLWRIAEAPE